MQNAIAKAVAWTLAAILSVLVIASRKHYTVDIVIAWYVVPLVFLALERLYVTKRNDGEVPLSKSIELQSVLVDAQGRGGNGDRGSDSSRLEGDSDAEACVASGTSRETVAQFQHGAQLFCEGHSDLQCRVARAKPAVLQLFSRPPLPFMLFPPAWCTVAFQSCTGCLWPASFRLLMLCIVFAGLVSPKGYRSGNHSRRPTNDGLNLQRGWENGAVLQSALPARIQSKAKLGPLE